MGETEIVLRDDFEGSVRQTREQWADLVVKIGDGTLV